MTDLRQSQIARHVWARTPQRVRAVIRPTPPAASLLAPAALPVQFTAQGSRRPLPLPPGLSREDVFELLASVSIEASPTSELRGYLEQDFERFLITWGLVRNAAGMALEIGANPYFTTALLRELTELDVTLTNSFTPYAPGTASQSVSYRPIGSDVSVDHDFEYHMVNVEEDHLPFGDATFDVVLFCEVLEHLVCDPVRALLEMKRVLRPGGTLIVSTPNVARLENVARLVAGANMYDPYSGYGPYGRHNREYTRHELVKLLDFVGFDADEHFTADVHAHATSAFVEPRLLAPLLESRLEDLGQYIFVRALNARPARTGRPSALFRSMPDTALTDWD